MKSNRPPSAAAARGMGLFVAAPLVGAALALLSAQPSHAATASICALSTAANQPPDQCPIATNGPANPVGHSGYGYSSLLEANHIPLALGKPGSLPKINGIPCTGANTGKCIGLQLINQTPVVAPRSIISASR